MRNFNNSYNSSKNQQNVVYTSEKIVSAMLSSVKDEIERIDSRVLEPSCGTGNFLNAIIQSKLRTVVGKYIHSRIDFEFYTIRTAMSIYGVEIDPKVVILCRKKLEETVSDFYNSFYSFDQWTKISPIIKYIFDTNIICGDSLSLKSPLNGNPIVFAEWSFLGSYNVKRRDFIYEQLINKSENAEIVLSDRNIEDFIPKPVKDYPIVKIFNILNYA